MREGQLHDQALPHDQALTNNDPTLSQTFYLNDENRPPGWADGLSFTLMACVSACG